MSVLPEPTPTAPAAGQATTPLADAVISAAVDNAIEKAKRHGTSPEVVIGSAPPVEQPGRPSMSQRAVDVNTTILTSSVLTAVVGGSVTAVLWASGHADPIVVGLVCAAPVGIAAPVLAFSRLVRRVKEAAEAAPPVINNNYTGPVYQDQRNVHTKTSGVWAKTTNQQ